MSWIDICAAISAQRHCHKIAVTASIDRIDFIAPVKCGWVVNLRSRVNYVGKSSMEVGVRVDAENPHTGETLRTASAYLTFVAVDEKGLKATVPSLILETEDDRRRNQDAFQRRSQRLGRRQRTVNS